MKDYKLEGFLYKALDYIISTDKELEVIDFLMTSHKEKHKKIYENYQSAKSSLRAIYKINASDNVEKKSAIESLSEEYK